MLRGVTWIDWSRRALLILVLVLVLVLVLLSGGLAFAPDTDTTFEAVVELFAQGLTWLIAAAPFGIAIGLWMASRPEPSPTDESEVTLRIVVHTLVVPMFGLWWWLASLGSTLPAVVRQLGPMLCFGVVWLDMLLSLRHVRGLAGRCEAAAWLIPARDSKAIRWLPAIILVLYWLGPVRAQLAGFWTLPTAETQQSALIFMAIAWLGSLGWYVKARPVIEKELQMRRPD
jgi:hypothetical protein